MRVAIDLTPLQSRVTGCDRYLLELVGGLATIDQETEYVLFVNRGDRARLGVLPANFRAVALPFRGRAARLMFQQAVLPLWLPRIRADVLHSPSFFTPLLPTRTRHLLTVHDLTFFTMPHAHSRLRRSRAFRAGVRASIRRADLVIVPSHATAEDLHRLMPELGDGGVRVVPHGVASRFVPRPSDTVDPVLARLGIRKPYLLHVGTLEPRKNLEALVEAFRLLVAERHDLDLVLAGKVGWGSAPLVRRIESPDLAGRVHRLDYVADDDLVALYSGASVFVFPSSYEGFGLPPLEAMACGAPVVASAAGALPENLTGAAVLVDPTTTALAGAIASVLADPAERARRRAAGLERGQQFRWQRTASATRACYDELARRP